MPWRNLMNTLTDTELKVQGVEMLIETMGLVDAERFIALMSRNGFDYTEMATRPLERRNY